MEYLKHQKGTEYGMYDCTNFSCAYKSKKPGVYIAEELYIPLNKEDQLFIDRS
jgi:hypothetical protein